MWGTSNTPAGSLRTLANRWDCCREQSFEHANDEGTTLIAKSQTRLLCSGGAWLWLASLSSIASGAVADRVVCVEASRFLETTECINDRQHELNRLISDSYGKLIAKLGRPVANRIQVPYMRMRLMCRADIRCEYQWQISQLATYYRLLHIMAKNLPANSFLVLHQTLREKLKSGECAFSVAVDVSCGQGEGGTCNPGPGRGSRIVLADDLRGLSAEEIGAVSITRPGDPIVACKGPPSPSCVADGHPGNYWTFTNYRTGDSWQMADTIRGCGIQSDDPGSK
jgi:hypothetical protein